MARESNRNIEKPASQWEMGVWVAALPAKRRRIYRPESTSTSTSAIRFRYQEYASVVAR